MNEAVALIDCDEGAPPPSDGDVEGDLAIESGTVAELLTVLAYYGDDKPQADPIWARAMLAKYADRVPAPLVGRARALPPMLTGAQVQAISEFFGLIDMVSSIEQVAADLHIRMDPILRESAEVLREMDRPRLVAKREAVDRVSEVRVRGLLGKPPNAR